MANNIDVKDATDTTKTMQTVEVSSAHTPKISTNQDVISVSLTRPADTTAYTAGDAVANSTTAPTTMQFAGVARANGMTAKVVGAVLSSSNAPPATPPDFDLLLFDTDPTDTNDNAAFNPSDADILHCVAVIPFVGAFPFFTSGSGNQVWHWEGSKLVKCDAADTKLYGMLRIRSAYTPISGEVFQVKLAVEQA